MAYDLSVLDNFFSDPFSPFTDSSSHDEIYQSLQQSLTNSVDCGITNSIENLASELLSSSSSSPPSRQLENLSLHHHNLTTSQSFHPNASDSDLDFSANAMMEVKTEEFHHQEVPFEFETISFLLHSSVNNNNNNAAKLMQRSYSSNSFEDNNSNYNKANFLFKPPPPPNHHHLDSVLESPTNYYWPSSSSPSSQVLDSPHHAQIRRVCSTGDLQKMKRNQTRNASTEGCSLMEEPNFKVGRYSAEERKERIHRYRAKRNQRNFNKTIKYACRKTLADNRPRIRGRFARNDEAVEIPKAAMFNRYEYEDDLWIDGYNEEDEGGTMGRAPFYSSSYDGITQPQYQYYSY